MNTDISPYMAALLTDIHRYLAHGVYPVTILTLQRNTAVLHIVLDVRTGLTKRLNAGVYILADRIYMWIVIKAVTECLT